MWDVAAMTRCSLLLPVRLNSAVAVAARSSTSSRLSNQQTKVLDEGGPHLRATLVVYRHNSPKEGSDHGHTVIRRPGDASGLRRIRRQWRRIGPSGEIQATGWPGRRQRWSRR